MIALWKDATAVEMLPGFVRRTLATGDRVMMVEFRAKAGVALGTHRHPAEQYGYVVSGQIMITIDGVDTQMASGDAYNIPSECLHGARFVSDAVILETFSPPRDDYRSQPGL